MNFRFILSFLIVGNIILLSQSIAIPKAAKDVIKKSGLSNREIKDLYNEVLDTQLGSESPSSNDFKQSSTKDDLRKIYDMEKSVSDLSPKKNISLKNESLENLTSVENDNNLKTGSDEVEVKVEEVLIEAELLQTSLKNFGYNIFSGNPDIFQNSINESVDPNYIVSPGDEIIIMLWGETEFNTPYTVSRDGYIFIENVGQVFVNGLNVKKIEEKLYKLLKKVYSTIGTSTFFDISLGAQSLRPLRIIALGELAQPGAYNVSPSTTLFTSLYYFNGPTFDGSLRNIKLLRSNKNIAEIDFYDYLLKGEQKGDVQLQRDDVIFIPRIGKTVSVAGEINRTGIYELKENESLIDVIEFAGGLPVTTYLNRVKIDRIIDPSERSEIGIDRTIVDVSIGEMYKNSKKIDLYDGDLITFFKISDFQQNVVIIDGAVNRPGEYDLGDGLEITDLLNKADGLSGDIYLERVDVIRTNPDNSLSQLSFNLQKALSGESNHNINLQSNDRVVVYNLSDMIYTSDVSIEGHVLKPGTKQFKKGMEVFDLLFLGGGFKNTDHLSKTYLERADLFRTNIDGSENEIIPFRLDSTLAGDGIANKKLQMGDRIKIYSIDDVLGTKDQTVSVSGYVKFPGEYPLSSGLNILELLFLAGGINDEEFYNDMLKSRIDLIRKANKSSAKKILFLDLNKAINNPDNPKYNFKLISGDIIRVYSKKITAVLDSVRINGEVLKPGVYELKQNMTVKDLILEAGGASKNNFRLRVDISSLDPSNKNLEFYASTKTLDLNNDLSLFKVANDFNDENPLLLKPYDIVTIRKDPYFLLQKNVTINGLVYYPGDYPLKSPNDMVSDIINRAGGLREEAYPSASRLIRDGRVINLSFDKIIRYPSSKYNFIIAAGDTIVIGKKANSVEVEGAVSVQGVYQFFPSKKLMDYVSIAGGFTEFADKYQSYVVNPDGTSIKLSLLRNPKIMDGARIVVPTKSEKEFSFTEYATNVTQIWSDVTQAYFMILLAVRGTS